MSFLNSNLLIAVLMEFLLMVVLVRGSFNNSGWWIGRHVIRV